MPRLIDPAELPDRDETSTLGACAEAIHSRGFVPTDPDSVGETARWLARLGNNREFLGDILLAALKERHAAATTQGYGPQAIQLTAPRNGVFLRAAVWPAAGDALVRASGGAAFVYGLPHDHNFSFLTHGYFGPGYWSDYYEYEYEAVAGWTGERAHLIPAGRHQLENGSVMLYRAHRDVHAQLPADSLSVSLNVMHAEPAMHWLDQYSFDVEKGTVTGRVDSGPSEAFLKIAVALGGEEALDLAERFAAGHPSERMRLTAFDALAGQCSDVAARDNLWARAEAGSSRLVAMEAGLRRAELAKRTAAALRNHGQVDRTGVVNMVLGQPGDGLDFAYSGDLCQPGLLDRGRDDRGPFHTTSRSISSSTSPIPGQWSRASTVCSRQAGG